MILVIKHAEDEGPGLFGEYLLRGGHSVQTAELYNKGSLPDVNTCDAILSMGGPMNVYEEKRYPFLAKETEFLKAAVDRKIPVLGICLGAQLLGKAMGSRVTKAPSAEVGWKKIRLNAQGSIDPLFSSLPEVIDVFQWHEDTFEIPKQGALLATSTACRNQAMRIGKCAWGLQFHPEVTRQMLHTWSAKLAGAIAAEKIMEGYSLIENNYKHNAELIIKNFLSTGAHILGQKGLNCDNDTHC